MNKIERRFTPLANQTTRVDRIQIVEVAVLYGTRQAEVLLDTHVRTNPAPRTLTRAERARLKETNRVGKRLHAE